MNGFPLFPLLDAWTEDWKYNKRREMQEIIPGLFLGPYNVACKTEKAALLVAGITHIVCVRCQNRIKTNFPETFTYLVVAMEDNEMANILPSIARVNDFILSALTSGGKVLVHGLTGCSRSACLVLGFLMRHCGTADLEEALHYLQGRRFCICPSVHFITQLKEYEVICKAHQMQSIEGVDPDLEERESVKRRLGEDEGEGEEQDGGGGKRRQEEPMI